jgi:enamine deaminase RidA (YjgF/YER057c/UK114 family)
MYKKKVVAILPQKGKTLNQQIQACFSSVKEILIHYKINTGNILKQSVFIRATNNIDFQKKKDKILGLLKDLYCSSFPPTSIIGQPPDNHRLLALELILLIEQSKEHKLQRHEHKGVTYITLSSSKMKEIFCGGITVSSEKDGILESSTGAFKLMQEILTLEDLDFSHVVRQWNYIQNITGTSTIENNLRQNYQIFNDVRSSFYETAEFKNGYPAATGIGMNVGGIILEFIALKAEGDIKIIPVKNPRQVDAHQYSQEVLAGDRLKEELPKTTPKFERAKLVITQSSTDLYVSGTAAILGQNTMAKDDVEAQTVVTIENILSLLSEGNLNQVGRKIKIGSDFLSYFRVYVKRSQLVPLVKKACNKYFKGLTGLYLISDICRDELLVEIEASG